MIKLIKDMGWTNEKIGQSIGVTHQSISKMLNSKDSLSNMAFQPQIRPVSNINLENRPLLAQIEESLTKER